MERRRFKFKMPQEMKDAIESDREISELNYRLRKDQKEAGRLILPEPENRCVLYLPEGFTGRDLKRAKRLMRSRHNV